MSTYTPIASQTLSSAAASVTFSGIPQNYTDLILVCSGKNTGAVDNSYYLRFNSDTGSNYSGTLLYGNGSSAVSARNSNQTSMEVGRITTEFYPSIIHIMNYSNTTTNKTVLSRGGTNAFVVAWASLWRSTSAITTIDILPFGSAVTFASGTTFNLYGIANASITNVAKATGGDTVVTDGTYWYHVFRSSGTFTPTQALTADCLVIAGGGGGGRYYGGGGGAGGLLAFTAQSLTAQNYTVTVGSGGAGYASTSQTSNMPGVVGSDSQFGSLTAAKGGGYGGGSNSVGQPGGTGGSGGGAGGPGTGASGGSPTSSQGYAGGNSASGGGGGGGGGAGGAGANSAGGGNAGVGGVGSSTYSSWGSATSTGQLSSGTYYYAGGGGGSGANAASGGLGGGGSGASDSVAANNGTANTGGGGGGGSWPNNTQYYGANGGSGIVIVRYAV